jgi:hypothetical protein
MILVAISLVSLLTVAALAIDVVTLYVARSEIQRAADAAAIAGAKAVADSGVTTLNPSDPELPNAKALAQTMATSAVNAILSANPAINQVAGITPTLAVGSPTVTFPAGATPPNSNPQVTVKLQVTTLPTFFARILGNRAASATATATAEAYNPANVQNFTPIAPKAVKPWLVANADPNNSSGISIVPFINTTTGAIEVGVIGETLNLHADCATVGLTCTLLHGGTPPTVGPPNPAYPQVEYVPAEITANAGSNLCPASCLGATVYEQSIECADMTTSYQCGGSVNNAHWDVNVNPSGLAGLSALGAECLIHAGGTGNNAGQDKLDNPGPWPTSAMQITAQSGPQNGNVVTTSNSIVTIPIIDTSNSTVFQAASPYGVTIVGFLQGFIDEVHGGNPSHQGDIKVTVLNIAGCSSTPNAAPPIVGGTGTSPIPVRLITPP